MNAHPLERKLGHQFVRQELLFQALTHRSHSSSHNERLEFVGDSVLNCAVAALLYTRYPKLREGDLSRLRASLVRQEALAGIAQGLEIGRYLQLGEGELKSGGAQRPSILADALEALFGAILLDANYDTAAAVIERLCAPLLAGLSSTGAARDPKTALQEYLQGRRLGLPKYTLCGTRGEAHAQEFEVSCSIPELGISCQGSGTSRRGAEQAAASRALELVQGQ